MKRVFEFYTGKGQQDITTLAESLECVRRSGKPTRITIEDLPESKPETTRHIRPVYVCNIEPESKPGLGVNEVKAVLDACQKQDKNCGNCGFSAFHTDRVGMDCFRTVGVCHHYSAWVPKQPKPAEPQGWEQRFDTFWKSYADKEDVLYTWNNCQRRKDELLSFIRAEIERVREEEKQAIVKYSRELDNRVCISMDCDDIGCIDCIATQIEQNKHRQ